MNRESFVIRLDYCFSNFSTLSSSTSQPDTASQLERSPLNTHGFLASFAVSLMRSVTQANNYDSLLTDGAACLDFRTYKKVKILRSGTSQTLAFPSVCSLRKAESKESSSHHNCRGSLPRCVYFRS